LNATPGQEIPAPSISERDLDCNQIFHVGDCARCRSSSWLLRKAT
jgi:hypothetical protein